jgi:hypothetical protein
MTVEEQKKLEEQKAAELKKAEDAKKAAEAKAGEKTVTEEQLLKAIQNLEEFAKAKEDTEEEEEEEVEEKSEKSYAGNFEEDETLEKAIEVSPFLEAIVGETVTSITAMGKDINKLSKSMGEFDGKHIETIKAFSEVVRDLRQKSMSSSKQPMRDLRKSKRLQLVQGSLFSRQRLLTNLLVPVRVVRKISSLLCRRDRLWN